MVTNNKTEMNKVGESQNYTIFKKFVEECFIFDLLHIDTEQKFKEFCSNGGLNAYLAKTNNYKTYNNIGEDLKNE